MQTIDVKPLGLLARFANWLMIPVMYIGSGTFSEKPQLTHRWNNQRLEMGEFLFLITKLIVTCEGLRTASKFRPILFHLPLLGGWRDYVVLEPESHSGEGPKEEWYVGWIATHAMGVSRIKLKGPARLLIGPNDILFFALRADDCRQIQITKIGNGRVGEGGKYAKTPLL